MRGTAVVASDRGGPSEVVRNGETGLLVEPGDPTALAGALTRILGDRDLAERMGAEARRFARGALTNEVFLDEVERLYARIVASPRERRSLAGRNR